MSLLSKDQSILGALAIGTAVYGIYNLALPSIADARSAPSHDDNLASSERAATWATAGLVSVVSILAKDPTIFTTGGLMVIGMAWWHRHSNAVEPALGGMVVPHPQQVMADMAKQGDTPDMSYAQQG